MSYFRVLKIRNNKCEFFKILYFIKFHKKEIIYKDVKEILLKTEEKNITIGKASTSKALYSHVESKIYEFIVINSFDEYITIYKSSSYYKVYKIGKFFSKYFNKPLKEIKNYNDLTDYDNFWLP